MVSDGILVKHSDDYSDHKASLINEWTNMEDRLNYTEMENSDFCPAQILEGLVWNWTQVTAGTGMGHSTADIISYHARAYQSIRIVCKVF